MARNSDGGLAASAAGLRFVHGTTLAVAAGLTAHALSNLPVLILGLVYLGREGLTLGKVAAMTEEKAGSGAPPEDALRAEAGAGRR